MNSQIKMMNEAFRRQPIDLEAIMKMPHKRLHFPWLVTRGNSVHARIYVWENKNF